MDNLQAVTELLFAMDDQLLDYLSLNNSFISNKMLTFLIGDPDGPGDLKISGQPESPSSKKRRTTNTPNQIYCAN
ncbi:UNVERIFIED_CONTAM: hypothetical protein NCL1_19038 [Trichonephila clavipes]